MKKNKVFLVIVSILSIFFISVNKISADIIDYNGGTSGSVSDALGKGSWTSTYLGIKIGIVNSKGELEDVEIILDKNYMPSKMRFSANNKSKPFQGKSITWTCQETKNYVRSGYVPDTWGYNTFTNLHKHLSDDDHYNLKGLLNLKSNNKKIFQTLGPGDYIIVEPMTFIGRESQCGYFGTAFELANAFFTDSDSCWKKGKFCYQYGRRVFGGSGSNKSGGVFYTTIYLSQNITIGNKTLTYFSNNGSSFDKRKERNNCLKSNTCGRGMGVYKYDDIYDSYNITYHGNGGLYNGSDTWLDNIRGPVLYGNNYTTWSNDNFFVRDGYEFTGWNEKSDGTGTDWTSWINKPWKWTYTRDVDLYAQWRPIKYGLDLNYCINGKIEYNLLRYPTNFSYDFKINGKNSEKTYYLDSITEGSAYEVSNIKAGSNYIYKGYNVGTVETCKVDDDSNKISGTLTQPTVINLVFESSCSKKLAEIIENGKTAEALFNLYKEEKDSGNDYRNLLNISSPSCTAGNQPDKDIKNLTCLSGSTLSHANFNELNLSQYDESITDVYGNYVGFCLTSMYLKNNLGVQSFYSNSGQFLVKQDNDEIKIYNSQYKPVRVCGNDVATATVRKMCYVLPGKTYTFNFSSGDTVGVNFGDNDFNNSADRLNSKSSIIKDGNTGTQTTNELIMYEYEKKIQYTLNSVNLEKITGKFTTETEGNVSVKGIISKFNSYSGKIPFTVTYKGKTFGQSKSLCTYETTPEIIKEDLQLEFRTIDTDVPFNRTPNTNWNDGSNQGDYNNEFVNNYIINSINSYGFDKNAQKQEPIYKIELTPSDIKNIREYNKEVPYDKYKVDCRIDENENEVCSNTFIENLKQGKVVLYEDDGDVKKTLSNSNGLDINNVYSNKITSTNSNTIYSTEINEIINTKICFPVTSSIYGNVPNGSYNIGDEYKCKVKSDELDEEKWPHFFVIGTCGDDKVNMIMSGNLANSATRWGDADNNHSGPTTALANLKNLTSGWSNIVAYNYTLIDEISQFKNNYINNWANEYHPFGLDPDFEMYAPIEVEDVRARLLTKNEADACGCARSANTCPAFLQVGLEDDPNHVSGKGYWLSSASSYKYKFNNKFDEYDAHDIIYDGGDASRIHRTTANSLRPVITVYKSQISN